MLVDIIAGTSFTSTKSGENDCTQHYEVKMIEIVKNTE